MRAPVACPVGRPFESAPTSRNRRDCRSAAPVVARTVSPFSTSFRFLSATRQLARPLLHVGCQLLDSLAWSDPSLDTSLPVLNGLIIGVSFPGRCPIGLFRTAVFAPPPPRFTVRTGDRKGVRS